ncbi:dolichol kinase EVAN-like isoform X1 [Dioscorea cayenensis subsp. rotundata]|uniref:dolichol kinase n=2 Tax=Dioscorea cayennensis subsp. rotundata TaxID=55577 RepID=A0AB40AT10_DIOCR|nr:dolichol kinase EVAN-like isoform X1 [Dioscorea cayenensis subsp. rotundata]XP_039118203.1 dolichol kinase EVAN-like isoform X1 [Dioscorea cayenensis subsp. rotundata]
MLDRMHVKGPKLLGSRAFSSMVARLADLCNGERVVVFLFVSCILFSTPSSLALEAAALLILSFAALVVEISTEGSRALFQFKTRPGASSGMLLGSVTMPAAMLSRLILVSRAISQHHVGSEDFSYMGMLYWAVSACSFGVLILCSMLQNLPGDTSSRLGGVPASTCSLFCTIFYMCSCYLSLTAKSYAAWHATMNLVWYLCHGIATVALIRHILHKFPYCASIGEALLVTSGLVLYAGDMLALSLSKILSSLLFMEHAFVEYGTKSEIHMVLQGMLLGILLFPSFYKSVLYVGCLLTSSNKSGAQLGRGWAYVGISRSMVFYFSLIAMLILIVPAWMMFAEDFHIHPLQWVVIFVFTEPLKRTTLCIYWISVICASVFRFYNISKQSKIERILLRKYYHLVAVLVFVPAIFFEPTFLDLAFGAALAVFLIMEMIRVWEIWPLGHIVRKFMNAFTDHRDSEILVISHFSLLLGCALPKWMSSGYNDRPLVPFAGILSLGIGDTMASMVGHKYGVLRWSKTGKKTIEGTVAGIASVLVACFILLHLASAGYILSQHWVPLLLAVTLSGLLEAYTAQLDNAFIPLVFYSLLCL